MNAMGPNDAGGKLNCEDMQPLLFDYMNRELGSSRSDLVREHLRRCERCQAAAAEIQDTLNLLHTASKSRAHVPSRLSDKHRARIKRSVAHPVIAWIERHHVFVSVLVAAFAVAVILGTITLVRRRERIREKVKTVVVHIGPGSELPPPTNIVVRATNTVDDIMPEF